ncbi:MAG: hypothetical protein R3E39_23990 [Anaerolineae bacterium]
MTTRAVELAYAGATNTAVIMVGPTLGAGFPAGGWLIASVRRSPEPFAQQAFQQGIPRIGAIFLGLTRERTHQLGNYYF